jgi:F0F1-type ATP synthase assembly protein I
MWMKSLNSVGSITYNGGMDKMTNEEIIKELKERIADLVPYIEADDGDSEYFQGVQEGYILSLAMLTGEVVEGTILPAY